MLGVGAVTPIINPPQVAILGVGAIRRGVNLVDGELAVEHRMTLTLVSDHRVLYGAQAAHFVGYTSADGVAVKAAAEKRTSARRQRPQHGRPASPAEHDATRPSASSRLCLGACRRRTFGLSPNTSCVINLLRSANGRWLLSAARAAVWTARWVIAASAIRWAAARVPSFRAQLTCVAGAAMRHAAARKQACTPCKGSDPLATALLHT